MEELLLKLETVVETVTGQAGMIFSGNHVSPVERRRARADFFRPMASPIQLSIDIPLTPHSSSQLSSKAALESESSFS
jgi:hypothetical protein